MKCDITKIVFVGNTQIFKKNRSLRRKRYVLDHYICFTRSFASHRAVHESQILEGAIVAKLCSNIIEHFYLLGASTGHVI